MLFSEDHNYGEKTPNTFPPPAKCHHPPNLYISPIFVDTHFKTTIK